MIACTAHSKSLIALSALVLVICMLNLLPTKYVAKKSVKAKNLLNGFRGKSLHI